MPKNKSARRQRQSPARSAEHTGPTQADSTVPRPGKGSNRASRQYQPTPDGPSAAAEGLAERGTGTGEPFPVVGVGASAGGLEAFTILLNHLPADTGMAFVLVQHLDPSHESLLTSLLSKSTRMPVHEVVDGMLLEPNHVFVMPPNTDMVLSDGRLKLAPRTLTVGQHMPVDHFFRSLAESRGSRAIAVILSGTASDGALSIAEVKAAGGVTFVQDQRSAKYDGMPRSAIATGSVDFILPPDRIAQELAEIGRHSYVTRHHHGVKPEESSRAIEGDCLQKIFKLVHSATRVDFTHYKLSTIQRRIARRMALHKIERLDDYLKLLHKDAAEVTALYEDMLIRVTSFFRDPESFEALKGKVFPRLLKNRTAELPVRIWVPGCSTGEEVYSIAICLLEFLGDKASNIPVQIFATDISEPAIERARTGLYIENIALDVSPGRLQRFFVKVDGNYRVSKSVRDICVFARQNMTQDPPFSRLDLISCRNVLIYMEPVLQKKVLSIFHYALRPSGFLLLGSAEGMAGHSGLFTLMDREQKVYVKNGGGERPNFGLFTGQRRQMDEELSRKADHSWQGFDLQKEGDRIALARFAPPGVIIDEKLEILHFRGETSPYLAPAPGRASLNLLKMARPGLLLELRSALRRAGEKDAPVRREGVQLKSNHRPFTINLEVIPLKLPLTKEPYFMVLFEEAKAPPPPNRARAGREGTGKRAQQATEQQISKLQKELEARSNYLQDIIEEQGATNEELRSANEEILSSNEELQSTNEELETAKEELQSANEELTTLNEELQNRNLELNQLNNDLRNLLSSIRLPVVMLESDLRIRRFTPMAEKLLNLIPSDLGRPITDLRPNIVVPDLERLVLEVIDSVSTREREVQDQEGQHYLMQIRPYKTTDNKIDGAVITFLQKDQQPAAIQAASASDEQSSPPKGDTNEVRAKPAGSDDAA
jgi:two-component system, chemotaxis family, CheB/CheR fusion protein